MKSITKTLFIAGAFSMALSISAIAGSWGKNENGWWYLNDDGSYPVSEWKWIDSNNDGTSECYYFDDEGYLVVDDVTPDGYTVNENGAWVDNGVIQTQKKNTGSDAAANQSQQAEATVLNKDGWYYIKQYGGMAVQGTQLYVIGSLSCHPTVYEYGSYIFELDPDVSFLIYVGEPGYIKTTFAGVMNHRMEMVIKVKNGKAYEVLSYA